MIVAPTATWYFDIWHEPVESIDELIGQNYDFAHKIYFKADPDNQYTVNIKDNLNEFEGGALKVKEILTDSVVHVFTWNYTTHKKTIWIGDTKYMKSQIIDAIRYRNNVRF